jgi:hypothetical protein
MIERAELAVQRNSTLSVRGSLMSRSYLTADDNSMTSPKRAL